MSANPASFTEVLMAEVHREHSVRAWSLHWDAFETWEHYCAEFDGLPHLHVQSTVCNEARLIRKKSDGSR